VTIQQLLTDPNAYGTSIVAALLPYYDSDLFNWDPNTIELQLEGDFKLTVPQSTYDKIQAVSSILTTNLFHVDVPVFCTVCSTLNRGIAVTDGFVPAGIEDMAWGLTEANLLEGKEFWEQGFSDDIARYTGIVLEQSGLYEAVKPFQYVIFPENMSSIMNENLTDELEFKMFWDKQADRKKDVASYVQQKLLQLFEQLKELPIKDKNNEFLDSVILKLRSA
jgi:hypothetical protein